MLTFDLAMAGLGLGAVAALSGAGVLVTYRLTGVLNLAFGAIAMFAAYLLWQAVRVWHLPLVPSAVVDIAVVCPSFGWLVDRLVFRSLLRRRAGPAERLVASIGLLVVLVGSATAWWGSQTRLDVPSVVPFRRLALPGRLYVSLETVVDIGVALVVALALAAGLRTSAGRRVRAVIADRDLAAMRGIDVDRVSAAGWAIGSAVAGAVGVLLAPSVRLQPFRFTLVVLETLVVVVVARLADPARAVIIALVLGIAQAEMTRFHPGGRWRAPWESLTTNLFVVALLVAVVLLRSDQRGALASPFGEMGAFTTRSRGAARRGWWLVPAVLAVVPMLLGADDRRTALAVPAMAIILCSIVAVSGLGGHLALGQAGFAGLGALVAGALGAGASGAPHVPGLPALVVAPIVVAPLGMLVGRGAVARRGLSLGLTTLAVGVVVSRFLLDQPWASRHLAVGPPGGFGSDANFWVLELGALAVSIVVLHNLRTGRLGRALAATRDDSGGAAASGVDILRVSTFVVGAGAAMAALGGALLMMGARAFDASAFDPVRGLIWFAAVLVMGIDSTTGAVVAAGALVAGEVALPAGATTLVVGLLALVVGRMPGGIVPTITHAVERRSTRRPGRGASTPTASPGRPVLSPVGRALVARLVARGSGS